MAVKISPVLNEQQFSDAGVLLSGGKIETYLAGSTTPAATYNTSAGVVAQSNPIILNTRGEVDNAIYLTTGISYKFVLKDSAGNVLRTFDNIEGINDNSSSIDQWINSGVEPTFISATQFSLSGDQTTAFHVNRRVKLLVTAGTVYGYISASAFGVLTIVTVVLDSGVLDSGLSSVQLALITPNNSSLFKIQTSNIEDGAVTTSKLSTGAPIWNASGEFTVTAPALLGYGTGAGGAVTQATNKSTAVALNKPCGQITMSNAAMAAGSEVVFIFNNSLITSDDVVLAGIGNTASYDLRVGKGQTGFVGMYVKNISAGSLSDAMLINFAVIKGAIA